MAIWYYRNKLLFILGPLWRRIAYPVIGAVLVGEVFYLSVPENRNQINKDIKELIGRVWSK